MSDQPNDKLTLFDTLTEQAKQALEAQGSFAPLAISVSQEGKFNITSGAAFESAEAGLNAIIGMLHEEARRGSIRTAAVCVQANAAMPGYESGTDIIAIFIEHVQNTAIQVWRPFSSTPAGIVYGEPVALTGDPKIFR